MVLTQALAVTALFIAAAFFSCSEREFAELPVSDAEAETQASSVTDASAEEVSQDASSDSAFGEEDSWFLVTEVGGDRDYKVYVDTDTVETIDGEVMSWSKLVFDEDRKDSDGLVYREVRIASAIDCEKRTYMYLSSKFYDSLGKMVYMENIATNRSPIPAGTVSAFIADFVCGYKPPEGKTVTQ